MSDTAERKVDMTQEEFLQKCTACGGDWGAMLLTGIKAVFPEYYDSGKLKNYKRPSDVRQKIQRMIDNRVGKYCAAEC